MFENKAPTQTKHIYFICPEGLAVNLRHADPVGPYKKYDYEDAGATVLDTYTRAIG